MFYKMDHILLIDWIDDGVTMIWFGDDFYPFVFSE